MAAIASETLKHAPGDETNENKKITKENPNKRHVNLGKSVDQYELRRMPSILRSKFSFYIEPPSYISEAQTSSQKRLKQHQKTLLSDREKTIKEKMESNSMYSASFVSANNPAKNKKISVEEAEKMMKLEKERHERLIGQLKAAEARNRNRILKMRYFNSKQDEIDHLIDSQPTSSKAVRLEAFLPPVKSDKIIIPDQLNPIQRRRLEAIIDDTSNSLIERRLY